MRRGSGRLRDDLDPGDVADTLRAGNSPELCLLLTTERGWTPEHFRGWLTDLWQRNLLRP